MYLYYLYWHIAKVYFTCIKPLWWLFTVPNMNNIYPFIHVQDITGIHVRNNVHKCYIWAQNPSIHMHQAITVANDHCTKYKQNQPILLHTKHKIYEKSFMSQIWHRAKCYLTCISNEHMVPNYCTM